MSKFKFTREGPWRVLNTNGIPQARYTEKALIELRAAIDAHLSCVGAAMAEQTEQPNSCHCDTARWESEGRKLPCNNFTVDPNEPSDELMCKCGHWQICHQPQPPTEGRNQE